MKKVLEDKSFNKHFHFLFLSLPTNKTGIVPSGGGLVSHLRPVRPSVNFCRTPEGAPGECSDLRKCMWLVFNVNKLRQSICLRNLVVPGVCCPQKAILVPVSVSKFTFFNVKRLYQCPPDVDHNSSTIPAQSISNNTGFSYKEATFLLVGNE